jgi:hypothetical protein
MSHPLSRIGTFIAVAGGVLLLTGLLLALAPKLPLLGRLPGDFHWKIGNTNVCIPLATSILLSIVLTLVLNALVRLFK